MNPDYVAGLEADSAGSSILDWLNAGVNAYKTVTRPDPVTAAPPKPLAGAGGAGGFSPWLLVGGALALVVGLVVLLRR